MVSCWKWIYFGLKKLKQREGTLPPFCRFSTVTPLWPLAWLFIINGSGLWGNAKSCCSLPGCSRRGWEGEGSFPLCLWEKVRRKGGHQISPEELAKTFQFMRNILQAKAHGESALSICCVTGPHPSSARKSHTQPIRISEHSLNRSPAKCTLKHKEPEAACLHHDDCILHCHPAEWKQVRTAVRLKRKNGRWHFTTQYFQKDSHWLKVLTRLFAVISLGNQ